MLMAQCKQQVTRKAAEQVLVRVKEDARRDTLALLPASVANVPSQGTDAADVQTSHTGNVSETDFAKFMMEASTKLLPEPLEFHHIDKDSGGCITRDEWKMFHMTCAEKMGIRA